MFKKRVPLLRRLLMLTLSLMLCIGICMPAQAAAAPRLNLGYKWYDTPWTFSLTVTFLPASVKQVRSAMNAWNAIRDPDNGWMVSIFLTTGSTSNSIEYMEPLDFWVGYTDPTLSGDEILSVNIYLNTWLYEFSVGGSSSSYDIRTVVQHELGHALGVAHCHEEGEDDPCWSPTCNDNVMYRLIELGEVRTTFQPYDTASYINIYW